MEFSLRFMFCRNLKKRSRKAAKTYKKISRRQKCRDTRRAMSRHRMENVMLVTLMSRHCHDISEIGRVEEQCLNIVNT